MMAIGMPGGVFTEMLAGGFGPKVDWPLREPIFRFAGRKLEHKLKFNYTIDILHEV